MKLLKVSEMAAGGEIYNKLLIYGASGAGKTWATTTPEPGTEGDDVAILLTEANGLSTLRESAPNARVFLAQNIGEVREFMDAAESGVLKQIGIKRLVFDGLTEIQRLMKDAIIEDAENGILSLQDWQQLTEAMRRFMRSLRALPYDCIVTALEAADTEGEQDKRNIFPSFDGKKLHNEVAQFMSAVGYVHKLERKGANGERDVDRVIMWDGPSRILCKPTARLPSQSRADIGAVLSVLHRRAEPETIVYRRVQAAEVLREKQVTGEKKEEDRGKQEEGKAGTPRRSLRAK